VLFVGILVELIHWLNAFLLVTLYGRFFRSRDWFVYNSVQLLWCWVCLHKDHLSRVTATEEGVRRPSCSQVSLNDAFCTPWQMLFFLDTYFLFMRISWNDGIWCYQCWTLVYGCNCVYSCVLPSVVNSSFDFCYYFSQNNHAWLL